MAIDPGAKQVAEPWTTFADGRDIPEWITKAYTASYRGPHTDETETDRVAPAAPEALGDTRHAGCALSARPASSGG